MSTSHPITSAPWSLNPKASHPWIVEAPTKFPGVKAEICKVGYRPNAELIASAPDLLELAKLTDAFIKDLTESNPGYLRKLILQNYGNYNDLLCKLEAFRKKQKEAA